MSGQNFLKQFNCFMNHQSLLKYASRYYEKVRKIKSGGYGIVYAVKEKKTKKLYAAKVLKSVEELTKSTALREINIMMSVQHPSIVKFYNLCQYDFDMNPNYTIIMDLAENGSLSDYISLLRKGLADVRFNDTIKQIILVGISSGMMFLHKHDIAHRDLKPANILLDENFHPLITDFGLSKNYNTSRSANSGLYGTSIYIPPEELDSDTLAQHSKEKADVYSFGILMFELLTHLIPYPDLQANKITQYKFYTKVIKENYRPTFEFPIEAGLKHLIERCWSKNIETRPTFKEIFELLSTNEEYFLSNVDRDELEAYVDELNNSIQKVNTEKVINSALQKSSTQKEIDELKIKINELEQQNAQIMKAMNHQDEVIQQQREIIFSFQEKIAKETEKRQQLEQDMKRMQKQNETLFNDIIQRINKVHVAHEDSSHKPSEEPKTANDSGPNKKEGMLLSYKVFVTNIPYDATAQQLAEFFINHFGEIKEVRIITEQFRSETRSSGNGFVEFKDKESMEKALRARYIIFHGKKLHLMRWWFNNMFIKGIPEGATEGDIRNTLRDFNLDYVKIVKYVNNQFPGFAFVRFALPEDLKNLIDNHRTIQIKGEECRIFVARIRKPERKKRYSLKRAPRCWT